MASESNRYSGLSRALHWVSALIIFTLIAVGLYMTGLDENDPARTGIYDLHKAVGVLSIILLVARLVWLRVSPAPELPEVFNEKEKRVTKGIQSLLYVFMILLPVSGYVMSTAAGHPVSFFGLFELPRLLGESKSIGGFSHEVHTLLGYGIALFALVHMAGAIKHRLANKGGPSDVLMRML